MLEKTPHLWWSLEVEIRLPRAGRSVDEGWALRISEIVLSGYREALTIKSIALRRRSNVIGPL